MKLLKESKRKKFVRLYSAKLLFGIFLLGNVIIDFFKRNIWLSLFFFISIIFFLLIISIFKPMPPASELSFAVTIKIPSGMNFAQVTDSLYEKGVIKNKSIFQLLGVLSGKDQKIRSGLYRIPHEFSTWQILSYLTEGNNITIRVTIPEGITSDEIAQILQREIEIDSARFIDLVNDENFSKSLKVENGNLEGYLLPETYYFDWRMPEKDLLRFLVNRTLKIFDSDSIQQRLDHLNLDINEVLTLASIIEGEVLVDSERVIVSSVYHNRLNRGWRLQADPTIQYILPGKPRRLTYRDLNIDSSYNTYKYSGLPPGPINNPGKKSILAALYPAETKYLYFVATGDGGHRFSTNSEDHAYWKRRFDQVRRQVRLEERRKKRTEVDSD
jgi:UPF0755 protein